MLIDEFLPVHEVATHHEIEILAPIDVVYGVVRALDFSDSRLARTLVWVRNAPALLRGERGLGLTLDDLLDLGFILLADDPPHELVLGFVGQFWTASGNLRKLNAEAFRGFDTPGHAKAVMNFALTRLDDTHTVLATDSRAYCLDEGSRQRFRRYMFITNRLRSVLRWSLLRSCKRRAEARSPTPDR